MTLTVNNIDTSLTSYFMASTGSQVRLNLNLQAQTANGPFNTGFNFSQPLFPGDSMFTSMPDQLTGPGQANLTARNTGAFTTAVTFTATQMCTSQAGP